MVRRVSLDLELYIIYNLYIINIKIHIKYLVNTNIIIIVIHYNNNIII